MLVLPGIAGCPGIGYSLSAHALGDFYRKLGRIRAGRVGLTAVGCTASLDKAANSSICSVGETLISCGGSDLAVAILPYLGILASHLEGDVHFRVESGVGSGYRPLPMGVAHRPAIALVVAW